MRLPLSILMPWLLLQSVAFAIAPVLAQQPPTTICFNDPRDPGVWECNPGGSCNGVGDGHQSCLAEGSAQSATGFCCGSNQLTDYQYRGSYAFTVPASDRHLIDPNHSCEAPWDTTCEAILSAANFNGPPNEAPAGSETCARAIRHIYNDTDRFPDRGPGQTCYLSQCLIACAEWRATAQVSLPGATPGVSPEPARKLAPEQLPGAHP